LEAAKVAGKREVSGRQRILAVMRDAFEQAGVAKFVLPVPVAPYTKPGDPFQFDFGYRIAGEIKLFPCGVSESGRGLGGFIGCALSADCTCYVECGWGVANVDGGD